MKIYYAIFLNFVALRCMDNVIPECHSIFRIDDIIAEIITQGSAQNFKNKKWENLQFIFLCKKINKKWNDFAKKEYERLLMIEAHMIDIDKYYQKATLNLGQKKGYRG